MKEIFSKRLKSARTLAALSQDQLVEKMGKGVETVPVDVEDLSELVGLLGDYIVLSSSSDDEDNSPKSRFCMTFKIYFKMLSDCQVACFNHINQRLNVFTLR